MKKKLFKSFIALVLASLMCVGLFACGEPITWKSEEVTLKNWGSVIENNGFVAETQNYYYYINGVGVQTDDNTFGAPIKGSLMAVDKADLTKKCVVVPKLFVATDYKAGIAIYGDYVYYGTPCTDRDSSGNIANSKMTFARTKLDGTDTTSFVTVDALSVEHRFVKGADETIYIVYYDATNTKLVCYNTATKESVDICKTSSEAEKESLETYKLSDNGNGVVVTYTTTVYTEEYNEELSGKEGYTRATASYNNLYVYKIGDTKTGDCAGVLVASGNKNIPIKYSIAYTKGAYAFIKESDSTTLGEAKTYAISLDKLYDGAESYLANRQIVTKADYLADSSIIVDLNTVYVSDGTYIKSTKLVGDDINVTEKYLTKCSDVSKLHFIAGDYVYYTNSSNNLARIKIFNIDAANELDVNAQIVSDDIINTTWYAPEILGTKVFYSDGSTKGCTYIKCVDVTKEVKEEKDDDGKVTKRYLDGQVSLAKATKADQAVFVSEDIVAITNKLESGKLTIDGVDENGVPYMTEVKEAKAAYDQLSDDQKELIAEDVVTSLNKYIEAERIQAQMYKLKDFQILSKEKKDALKTVYEAITAELEALKTSKTYVYSEIRALIAGDLNYDYQCAKKYFSAEKED